MNKQTRFYLKLLERKNNCISLMNQHYFSFENHESLESKSISLAAYFGVRNELKTVEEIIKEYLNN